MDEANEGHRLPPTFVPALIFIAFGLIVYPRREALGNRVARDQTRTLGKPFGDPSRFPMAMGMMAIASIAIGALLLVFSAILFLRSL